MALCQACGRPLPSPIVCVDGLVIDRAGLTVTRNGKQLILTVVEHRLLNYLAYNRGIIVTRNQILEHVWGDERDGDWHLLRVTISRLRAKIDDNPKRPRVVITLHGIGYMMPSAKLS